MLFRGTFSLESVHKRPALAFILSLEYDYMDTHAH